jgi:glyoxylase-like metal-dependent hydrolase (beta-lactamase superfamily II)
MNEQATTWAATSVQVGDWKISALLDGFFRLDGGAMWGVVPRNLWAPLTPPAEDNTIRMALRPYLCERGADKVIIEVGIGDRWSDKLRARYHIDSSVTLESSLRASGVTPEEITHVIASHCHWDHIGAQVKLQDGELLPRFANARHYAPAVEVQWAKAPGHARAGSYRAEDLAVIEELGLLTTYEGTQELVPGIKAHVLGGHSDGVAVITLNEDQEGDSAIFWSDVVPTTHHIQPPYIMAYDIDVVRSFEQRSEWLAKAAAGGWIGLFYHDPEHAFGRVIKPGRRYEFEALDASGHE